MTGPRLAAFAVAAMAVAGSAANAASPELEPLPVVVVDQLAEGDRSQLEARQRALDGLLASQEADTASLAQAFGDAGALYLLYDFADAAAACLRNAHLLDGTRFEWTYYLAVIDSREGRLPEAEAMLVLAAEQRARDLPTRLRLGTVRAAGGDWAGAAQAFGSALTLDPASAAAHHGLGRVDLARGDPAAAIEHFERALALQPEATAIHHQIGLAWRERGDRERAREHLAMNRHDAVRFADPLIDGLTATLRGARDHIRAGTAALADGDLQTALSFFRLAVETDSGDALAHYNLGRARVEAGDRDAAIASFRTALELDPAYRDAHVNLAMALAEAGKLDSAEPHFARAVALDPLDLEARRGWAVALDRQGQTRRAREVLETVLEATGLVDATAAAVHADLGRLAERDGDSSGAIRHYEAAVARAPEGADYRRGLAGALGRGGRFADAGEQLLQLVDRMPADVELRFGAAMALLLAEQASKARDVLEDGLEVQPGALPLRHVLARILATAPDHSVRDGARAVTMAQEVFRAAQSIDHAETVAMAFAESGDFAAAVSWQERVLERVRRADGAQAIDRASRRLARYRDGKTVRAPWMDG